MAADDRGGSRRLREAERRLRAQNRDGHGALQRLRRADDAAGRADVGVRQAGRGRHARLREHVRHDRHGRLLSGDGEKAGEPQPDSKRKILPERVPAQKADGAQGARRREGAAQKRPRQRAAGDVRFAASDIDMVREGATYTVDTLQILRQYYPNAEIWWLMGMDSLLSMHTWHRYQDIFKLANVAVAARNDEKIQQVAPEMRALVAQGLSQATSASKGQLRLLQWQPEDISSTQIRNAVKSGLAIDGWVPKPVRDYISTHGLYR